MPFSSTRAGSSARAFGLFVLSALKTVIDTFNRSDGILGVISGQAWKVWRGTWSIATNQASATSPASSYPAATLTFTSTDVTIGISTPAAGAGTVFWLSDANNWWGATYDIIYTCQTCAGANCNTYTSQCNASTCNAGNCNAGNCSGNACSQGICSSYTCNAYTCNQWTCNGYTLGNCTAFAGYNCTTWSANKACIGRNPAFCNGRNPSTCNKNSCSLTACASGNCNGVYSCLQYACNQWSCTTWTCTTSNCTTTWYPCTAFYSFFFSCNCTTTYNTNLIKNIAGTISSVANSAWNAAVGSFKVILSGTNVTVRTYNTANYTTQIGTDWTTAATGAVKNKKHGIMVAPANYSQGNTIDEFRVE